MPVMPRDDPDGNWLPASGQAAPKDTDQAMDDGPDLTATNRHGSLPRPGLQHTPRWLDRIAVRSVNRIVIVQVDSIARLEAEDNYVRIWADRLYLHKDTLSGLVARLDPARFLRVHRSHAINIGLVRELCPQLHGEYSIVLTDGTEITSGRSFKSQVQQAFGLG
ncbi:MAG: LytTR family DNA-binding domain-containing protein [Burkholderiales bacterium]|jgi:two-component system LytT family response regulator